MLPGKYVDVITGFKDPLELTGKVREGYLKVAWRSNSNIKIGYILTKRGAIIGSIVEDIIENTTMEGKPAFLEITEAVKHGLIKAVEIYEADVEGILKVNPMVRVGFGGDRPTSGSDLESFLSLLKTYKGGVKIQDGSKAWAVYVDKGLVKAARAIKGSTHHGDAALREIFHEMGHLLREGKYAVNESLNFSREDAVQNSRMFLEGLKLLKEKKEAEKDF
ncbi:DUF2226 domain-containing protein [Thermococcus sp.]|uniref:DUF2226 domain-containing protein n=1 Tax=Thermococcus sp. TaxID=35749 RepID=UPI002639B462|nr:DUF2226 domain-containing protein [Thermococcus sp.]